MTGSTGHPQTPLVEALDYAEAAARHLALLASETRLLAAIRDAWTEMGGSRRVSHAAACNTVREMPEHSLSRRGCTCGRDDFVALIAIARRTQ